MNAHLVIHKNFTRFYTHAKAWWGWGGLGARVLPAYGRWPPEGGEFWIAELKINLSLLWLNFQFIANLSHDRQPHEDVVGRWNLLSVGLGPWSWRRDRSTFPKK